MGKYHKNESKSKKTLKLKGKLMKSLKRLFRYLTMTCVVVLASGCATGSFCSVAKPIYFDSVDQVESTDVQVLRQIVIHNDTYESVCR